MVQTSNWSCFLGYISKIKLQFALLIHCNFTFDFSWTDSLRQFSFKCLLLNQLPYFVLPLFKHQLFALPCNQNVLLLLRRAYIAIQHKINRTDFLSKRNKNVFRFSVWILRYWWCGITAPAPMFFFTSARLLNFRPAKLFGEFCLRVTNRNCIHHRRTATVAFELTGIN